MEKQEIYIYKDFELISNDIINLVNTLDNNNIDKKISECYIEDSFIFINFPKQENGNNKLITLLGKLDKDNSFKTECILIYDNDNEDERAKYIKRIYDVKYFLNLYGIEAEPFTDESYKILGTIVKYKSTKKINEYNNYNINKRDINVYDQHNKLYNMDFKYLANNIKNEQHNTQLFSGNNNINNTNNENNFISKDNMINISFISDDQKIQHYNKTYKDTELFVNVEKELYENYPEYRDLEPFFLVKGNKIKRFRTLKENQIHNGDVIMLNSYNED